MMTAPTHSRENSSVMDVSDIQTALDMVKDGGRKDSSTSLVSWASQGTSAPTPLSTSPQQSSSESGSPCCSVRLRGSYVEDTSDNRRLCVKWSDECGLNLVTQVRRTTDFWDELVFGPAEACACTTGVSNGGSRMEPGTIRNDDSAGRWECEGCGGIESERQPGELFHFIEELSRGVEATLFFPSMISGITKKRRPVILYTDDNGESICWIKRGAAATASSSKEPYRIRSKTLVAVTDKSGVWGGGITDLEDSGSSAGGTGSEWRTSREGQGQDAHRHSRLSDSTDDEGQGGVPGVRLKLKWLPQPTWSKRTVKIADVKTKCPGMFTRGMIQLLSFNIDLQN